LYEYDFYDNWQHDIRLEKVLPLNLDNNPLRHLMLLTTRRILA
jgi:hypothetical protein